MKAGDKIRHTKICDVGVGRPGVRLGASEPKQIEYYGEEWVVYRVWSSRGRDLGEQAVTRKEFDRDFELVPDFFAEGAKYQREVSWSIVAQAQNVVETFVCDAVRTNKNGGKVAFGYLTAGSVGQWVILGKYDHEKESWKEYHG